MNLFLVGWNIGKSNKRQLESAFDDLLHVRTTLDRSTFVSMGDGDPVFAATVHTAEALAHPRRYVCRGDGRLTFYDGCVVDRNDEFQACDSSELAARWSRLTEILEGQFVVADVRLDPPRVELFADALGIYTVYYCSWKEGYLVSNSALLLEQISGARQLDPLGVSTYLTFGWAVDDRTLRSNIRVLPGGERWILESLDSKKPEREYYFRREELSGNRKGMRKQDILELGAQLSRYCASLGKTFGPLECPITAGRDSRLMMGMLLSTGTAANYFTIGGAHDEDVVFGQEIARAFDLAYEADQVSGDEIDQNWDELSMRLVDRTEGMGSLEHVRTVVNTEIAGSGLPVQLFGLGGEIARGVFNAQGFLLRAPSTDLISVQAHLLKLVSGKRVDLLSVDCVERAKAYIREFCETALDEGFLPVDIPDLFFTYERVRRWGGVQFRQVSPVKDVFSPFLTRDYLRAGFSVSATRRYTWYIQYELMRTLSPSLSRLPYGKPWPPQRPWIYYASLIQKRLRNRLRSRPKSNMKGSAPSLAKGLSESRATLLESKREDIRDLCLSQENSPLWEYVNKQRFSEITSESTPEHVRQSKQKVLFDIATAFLTEKSKR
ncbi:MAG: hypothetical protein QNJ07_14620 [Woeseiaceae bacterium]|nr:hypothetical protein [Woeseiaceae bacterium]